MPPYGYDDHLGGCFREAELHATDRVRHLSRELNEQAFCVRVVAKMM